MSSFADVINSLKEKLETNPTLSQFCADNWGRGITVKTVFKQRTEINTSDLPLILITRPSVQKAFRIGVRDATHTIRLYCGFFEKDRRKALTNFVGFEEAIDDALLQINPDEIGAIEIRPTISINDEGIYHPVYFIVMEVEILHRR